MLYLLLFSPLWFIDMEQESVQGRLDAQMNINGHLTFRPEQYRVHTSLYTALVRTSHFSITYRERDHDPLMLSFSANIICINGF